DYTEKRNITLVFACYLSTFLAIYIVPQFVDIKNDILSPQLEKFIYSFNFCSAFVLSFGIVTYFAHNNSKYIDNLISNQALLMKEAHLRIQSEEGLRKSLSEREILLGEIHHRVKNNLAIISALSSMQRDNLKEEEDRKIFEDTKSRIYTMALIHNQLYHNKSFAKIEFVEYVKKFCDNIAQSHQGKKEISIDQKIEDIGIDIKTAIPLALILNELITNSFKHAFKDRETGSITIGLMNVENNCLKCWVSDSGVGMNEEMLAKGGMGMEIVNSLADQIDAKLSYEKKDGSHFTLTFPICN
ncbi:MAG TPA: sensor histidine kinase, partial [Bacteroidia bacterium]